MSLRKKITSDYPGLKKQLLSLWNSWLDFKARFNGFLVRWPAWFKNQKETKVIARPGTLGFDGGVFNPGAVRLDDKIILLAKACHVPWYKARGKKRELHMKGKPVVFVLDNESLETTEEYTIENPENYQSEYKWQIEDFRLFKTGNRILVNHSFIEYGKGTSWFGNGTVSAALSVLDTEKRTLSFLKIPEIDFQRQPVEKNWCYLEHQNKLYMFYSLNPFRLLVEENQSFRTVVNEEIGGMLKDPAGFGTMVSISANPVEYDEDHYLMVIHQIQNRNFGRCYHHRVLLLSKENLKPVKITKEAIFTGLGARGRLPGIRYISSVIKKEDEFLFFGGEGDIFVTVARKKKEELDVLFDEL